MAEVSTSEVGETLTSFTSGSRHMMHKIDAGKIDKLNSV
jgi:hypothetical protein